MMKNKCTCNGRCGEHCHCKKEQKKNIEKKVQK